LTKIYTFGPTFRAENSNTSRHLAEFWMIEPEIAFADLSDNAALAEALLQYTFAALLKESEEDLAFFDQRIEKGLVAKLEGIVGSEFAHMDYGEAIQVLERANEKFEFPVKWGVDLQSERERYATEKHAKKPVIVMNYPKAIKAFYMRVNNDGRTVAAMDVRRGSARSSAAASARSGSTSWTAAWPSAASTRSTMPSTAICAATARCRTPASASASSTLAYVTGLANVRDAIPFPRTPPEPRGTRGIDSTPAIQFHAQVRSSRSTSSAAAIFFRVSTVPLRSPFSICDR
jgi:asparaginyl-tRNA synthetase